MVLPVNAERRLSCRTVKIPITSQNLAIIVTLRHLSIAIVELCIDGSEKRKAKRVEDSKDTDGPSGCLACGLKPAALCFDSDWRDCTNYASFSNVFNALPDNIGSLVGRPREKEAFVNFGDAMKAKSNQ